MWRYLSALTWNEPNERTANDYRNGYGNDQYGQDYTKAAARAIEDAIRHSALPIFEATGLSHEQMRVDVTVGVQEPDAVDCEALVPSLPRGRVAV